MEGNINPKIAGASILGFALVAGAYLISNFNAPGVTQRATVSSVTPAPRLAIAVTDNDGNGVEDWRDEFVTTKPVVLNKSTTAYKAPDTLTGKLGVNFMESIIRARGYGAFGRSDEKVIEDTIDILSKETAHSLYDTPDITIMQEWDNDDIYNYANAIGGAILKNNVANTEDELTILYDILNSKDTSRLSELAALAEGYKKNRDDFLKTPVPAFITKEHLDMINTFHAVHKDIEAMTIAFDDPAFTLLRLKRYEDDATGLGYAMRNMYTALEPHAGLFTANDPAAVFILFSPNYKP